MTNLGKSVKRTLGKTKREVSKLGNEARDKFNDLKGQAKGRMDQAREDYDE